MVPPGAQSGPDSDSEENLALTWAGLESWHRVQGRRVRSRLSQALPGLASFSQALPGSARPASG